MTAPTYHFIRNATARLTCGGKTFLLDPMLSDKGALPSFAGIAPNPTVDLPIPVADILKGIDIVIVSHLHGDHFDSAAAEMLDKSLTLLTPRNGASPIPREGAIHRDTHTGSTQSVGPDSRIRRLIRFSFTR